MGHMATHPLTDVKRQMAACIQCAACMPACPTYRTAHKESMGPRGRLALAIGLLEGDIAPEQGAVVPITSCIDCRACVPACPRHIPLDAVFYAAKAELSSRGAGGIQSTVLRWAARLIVVPNRFSRMLPWLRAGVTFYRGIADSSPAARLLPFFRRGKKRVLPPVVTRPMTDDYPERVTPAQPRGRVAFFPGCVINFTQTGIGHATIRVLEKLDIEVVIPREAPCCGIPLLSLGDREGARQVARDVVARYSELEVDAVITACASCGTTLRDTYPGLIGADAAPLADKVMDVAEYITAHTNYQTRAAHLDIRVTYHDPCHLVRGMGVTEAPRQILKTVAGDGFTEMRDADRCCGFGGLFSALHYDMALEVGAAKAKAVADSGAERVATGCPGCQMQLTDTLARGDVAARAAHTVELLEEAIDQNDVAAGKHPTPQPTRTNKTY
ncbi:MAG: (Fe-S)-binding protein [Leptospirillia bacterium]